MTTPRRTPPDVHHLPPGDRPSYARDDEGWRRLQALLPQPLRLRPGTELREEWRQIGRFTVHLDRHGPDAAPATVVLVHGGGGNGRLLAPYGQQAAEAGFAAVAPDLPGYGLTITPRKGALVYEDWRHVLSRVVEDEAVAAPDRPILLFGLSMGGMLAYDAMARTGLPRRLLATTLMPPAEAAVRRQLLRQPWLADVLPLMWRLHVVTDPLPMPMRWAANMPAIANDPRIGRALTHDPRAGGTWMPGRWSRTFLTAAPEIDPEDFTVGPVTLAHPAQDRWTRPDISQSFLERLTRVPTRLVMLDGAGHFPVEAPGRDQLHRLLLDELRATAGPASAR